MSEYKKIQWHFEADRFNNPEHEDKLGAIVDEEDFIIAEVCSDAPNALYSASLMAAAPELLLDLHKAKELHDCLRDMVLHMRGQLEGMDVDSDIINAVLGIIDDHEPACESIEKAEGK